MDKSNDFNNLQSWNIDPILLVITRFVLGNFIISNNRHCLNIAYIFTSLKMKFETSKDFIAFNPANI